MPFARTSVDDFCTANPLYVGGMVTFYTVDVNGNKTTTLANIYSDVVSDSLLDNPQTLDSFGKFQQPVYIDGPVIMTVIAPGLQPSHDTGIVSTPGRNRGPYQGGTLYYPDDIFQDTTNGIVYMVLAPYNAMTIAADLAAGNIELYLQAADILNAGDLTLAVNAAATAVAEAAIAVTAAGAANTSETNAAFSATQAAGSRFGTSTSNVTIGTGSKSFTTQTGLGFGAGMFVSISSSASPANYVHGQVTSYNSGTGALVVNVLDVGGSGNFASWNISPSGPQGSSGGGTGTVNSATAHQIAFYAANGTAVSGDPNATIINGDMVVGTAGSTQGSIALSGSTSGTTQITAPVMGGGAMALQAGNDTLVGQATTDIFTNKTLDTAGAGNHLKINGQAITSVSGNTAKVATVSGAIVAGNAAIADASGNLVDGGAPPIDSFATQLLHVREEQASGTGSATSFGGGGYTNMPLNVVKTNQITGASLNAGTGIITLPIGSYEVDGYAVNGQNNSKVQPRLFNNTDNATVVVGQSSEVGKIFSTGGPMIFGRFDVTGAPKDFLLQQYSQASSPGAIATGSAEVEVYSQLMIRKVG